MSSVSIPDWQLPPGTDRGLWDYLHNDQLAQNYDASLEGTPLLEIDLQFAEKWFSKPGKLIDLGCGTGRLLLRMAQKGFSCTGVDLSDAMLRVTEEKAKKLGVEVQLQKANLVELEDFPENELDWAACLFSTLGMIRGKENRKRFLNHVHRLLKPNGIFVLHAHNRWFHFFNRSGRRWLFREFFRGIRGYETGDRTMPQHLGGAELTLHHFTKRELIRDLSEAGFHLEEFQSISTKPDGNLRSSWFFGRLRAYGFLVAARKIRKT